MPCVPHPGEVTICEINRDLITAEILSNERAKETYGKVLGIVFSPIPFQPDLLLPNQEQVSEQEQSVAISRSALHGLKASITDSFKRIFFPNDLNMLTEVDIQGVSWHPHKHCLAFISAPNQVTVRDYEDSDGKDACILTSESQREIKTLGWRPNSGKMLSVACKGGICIWSASYPGNAAPVRSGNTSSLGTISRGAGVRWILVDFLRSPNGEQISALCWDPNGRYLASASCESSSFTIWDVSQGVGTPIRRGLGSISMLKWSPSGDYFLTTKFDGTFYLWETNTWTSEPWSSTSGYVTGATWDPEGRMILVSFSDSATLGSIHFASKPPSLDAHLLPVELPEISSLTGSQCIEKIALDASGERLALSYKGGAEMYSGLVAVYDIRRAPLVSASLVGFIRGPGEKPKPLAFAFHNKFKQGPLLSVCWSSGWCCTYPLLFRSHVLP
ncbi:aladin [Phoenix dactylifera]|uniref:Aladin n=1 Tax=Phoenix dactylifera TaxID=42345 RepID=A0A8B7C639_PHODC|nr:aladin [Phoenix dactylifera]